MASRTAEPVELLDVKAVAVVLDCSKNHVYRLIAAGELRVTDIALPGSARAKSRVRSDDIDAYIERNTRGDELATRRRNRTTA